MIMPVDRAELTDGRNVLFLTLMKGSYELKIFGDMCAIGENAFSVNGSIKTPLSRKIKFGAWRPGLDRQMERSTLGC